VNGGVLILNPWERTPTYHAWLWTDLRHVERDPKCGATGWRTCDVYIRRDHAEAFARPCRRCFP
jgi:hypothetical protein